MFIVYYMHMPNTLRRTLGHIFLPYCNFFNLIFFVLKFTKKKYLKNFIILKKH